MKKRTKIFIGLVIAVLLLIVLGTIILNARTYKPTTEALSFLSGSSDIEVTSTQEYFRFHNNTDLYNKDKAVIFYPGGLVEASSYSRFCFEVSKNGLDCFIAKMPLNLAIFNINAASAIIQEFPDVSNWSIGGHSLGGAMACRYLNSANNAEITELYLLASYCDQKVTNQDVKIVSIVGTNDQVLNKQTYIDSRSNLGNSVVFVDIDGGNHSNFGDYGLQSGDGAATVTSEGQISATVREIVDKL